MTPQEKYKTSARDATRLFLMGGISWDEYKKRIDQAEQIFLTENKQED